ncbi:calcium uptake protein 3, mitochondrial [Nematostella vectensis]|uniref:calcium uptake protein 3, mitochondrial n=1 Tax=Nematostella vectensis TaxID=45351 RepID=UPI0020770B17|nr:calcium uptake protein 3, mitochondrial [Nematostella vectensis]
MFARLLGRRGVVGFAVGSVSLGVCYGVYNGRTSPVAVVMARQENAQTRRQSRFEKFASCQAQGQCLMTPADFLESIVHEDLPGWSRKREVNNQDINRMLNGTPGIRKGSNKFFRQLQDRGIITYPEYLFLVTILTKSRRGIEIAFRMLDKDGNHELSKDEFLVLEEMVNMKATSKSMAALPGGMDPNQWQNLVGNTTLKTHFFTPRGNGTLTFAQFSKFMADLQVEVSEMEFIEYSRGMPTVPEESFARLLLRNTALEAEEVAKYLDRLNSRLTVRKGITKQQYVDFSMFLNNLDDFSMAMRIYSISGQPVTQDEFQRAVRISTGHAIDPYVVHTVFQLFDNDGDGKLSYEEFIELMKDKQKRGFRARIGDKTGWEGFKACVKKELSV